jgi:transcriptional regulator with XRE-family HTH domain
VLLQYKVQQQLTVRELEKDLEIDNATLNRLMHHGDAPSVKMLKQLARKFSWTAQDVGEMALYPGIPGKGRKRRGKYRDAA